LRSRPTDDQNQRGATPATATPLFRVSSEMGEVKVAKNQQPVPHAYREDTSRKDQGQALLDEGSVPPTSGEDGPASTDAIAPMAGEDDGSYKTPSKLVIQILIPDRSEYTSTRPNCDGGPEDALVPARGHFAWRVPMEIPNYWLKKSPSEGRTSGGEDGREGVISPLPHHPPPPHHHLLRIRARREFPPTAASRPPGRHTEAASVTATSRSWHGWPPAVPHPQAR
jgi:hypothetical protein